MLADVRPLAYCIQACRLGFLYSIVLGDSYMCASPVVVAEGLYSGVPGRWPPSMVGTFPREDAGESVWERNSTAHLPCCLLITLQP